VLLETAWAASYIRASYVHAHYDRMAHRRGHKKIIAAEAHSLSVIGYYLPQEQIPGRHRGIDSIEKCAGLALLI
jgi:hypothetical protein